VTLNCAGGRCEATPTPGDAKEIFDSAVGQITGHQSTARGAAVAEAKN
jgi:hypothetical protein